jgi:hypothetical protein
MRHTLGDLVDRAVTAGRDDEFRPTRQMFASQAAGGLGAGGGGDRYIVSLFFEDLNGPLDQRAAAPPEFSRIGIVNQDGVFLGWDVNSPEFLVKL